MATGIFQFFKNDGTNSTNMLPLLQKLDKHDDSSDIESLQSECSTPKETNEICSSGKIGELITPVAKMKVKRSAEISGKTEVKTALQRELNMQIERNAKEPDFNELTLKSQIYEFMLQGHISTQTLDPLNADISIAIHLNNKANMKVIKQRQS